MIKYLLSFLFGFFVSIFYLYGGSALGKTTSFDYLATKYYQIFHPEDLVQNGRKYTVSFGFVPVIDTVIEAPSPKVKTSEKDNPVSTEVNTTVKPQLVIGYSYQNNFDGFSKKEVEEVFKNVKNSWAPCGVILKYKGVENSSNPYYSGKSIYSQEENEKSKNFLYWVKEDGIYGEAASQSSQELTSKSKPFVSNFSIKLSTNIDSKERLEATIVHEFGHVIGLDHSSDPKSVMFYRGEEQQNKKPNDFDIQECKNVLNQIDLAKTNKMLN